MMDTPKTPPAPRSVAGGRKSDSIALMRDTVDKADIYELEIEPGRVISFGPAKIVVGSLSSNTRYKFRLRAANKTGRSQWSAPLSIHTRPSRPVSLKLSGGEESRSHDRLVLGWTGTPVPQFEISVNSISKLTKTSKSFVALGSEFGFRPNERLRVKVRAIDRKAGGESEWSSILNTVSRPSPPKRTSFAPIGANDHAVLIEWFSSGRVSWNMVAHVEYSHRVNDIPHKSDGDQQFAFVDDTYRSGESVIYTLRNVIPRVSVVDDVLKSDNVSHKVEVSVFLPNVNDTSLARPNGLFPESVKHFVGLRCQPFFPTFGD